MKIEVNKFYIKIKEILNRLYLILQDEKLNKILFFLRPVFALFIILFSFVIGAIVGISFNLASIQDVKLLKYYVPYQTTFIYDDKGKILAKLHDEENRIVVPLSYIPKHLIQAVIAIEDNRFYSHKGVDIWGILRAIKRNTEEKGSIEGGSTLTQQLAKNLFLSPERTIARKIAEAYIAIQIEKYYSKNDILQLYLNQAYLGHNAYGVEAASLNYFGKSVNKLNLAESAMLAGLLRAPENFSPYKNFNLAKFRQKLVLQQMVNSKFITPKEASEAFQYPIKLAGIKYEYKHPYFTTYVIDYLTKKYGKEHLKLNGLKVYTTINSDWQSFAEKIFPEEIRALRYNNVEQGALVCLNPWNGHVKAMIGGIDFEKSQFNRAFQAQRQPGSSFKPFTYLTAFASGYSPEDVEIDGPITYSWEGVSYSPKNYDGRYSGAMTLRRALVKSVNVVAVKLLDKVGINNVITTARLLGIKSELPPYLSLTLGAASVTPLEMASAYGVFATYGLYAPPTPILYIKDSYGRIIEDNRKVELKRVYDKDAVAILVDVLKDVPVYGTAYAARLPDRPSAGKTGTAENHKDVWYIGFIPQLVTAVWIGNDTPQPLWGATGGYFCAPIWRKFMTYATQNMPVKTFTPPSTFRLAKPLFKNEEKKNYKVTVLKTEKPDIKNKFGQPAPEVSLIPIQPQIEPIKPVTNSIVTPTQQQTNSTPKHTEVQKEINNIIEDISKEE